MAAAAALWGILAQPVLVRTAVLDSKWFSDELEELECFIDDIVDSKLQLQSELEHELEPEMEPELRPVPACGEPARVCLWS